MVIIGAGLMVLALAQRGLFAKPEPKLQTDIQTEQYASIQKPQKLIIPRLSKTLDITDGTFANDRWSISETGVSYLTSSALPTQAGNSVIYGHNKKDILGDLPSLKNGDQIYLVLANGNFVKYQVSEAKVIKSTQVEILNETQDSRLTIYTCSGFLDQARFVVIAAKVDSLI